MSHREIGGRWYVDGDPSPYDFEEEAREADALFWTRPARYIAHHDPSYEPPDVSRRTRPGRVA